MVGSEVVDKRTWHFEERLLIRSTIENMIEQQIYVKSATSPLLFTALLCSPQKIQQWLTRMVQNIPSSEPQSDIREKTKSTCHKTPPPLSLEISFRERDLDLGLSRLQKLQSLLEQLETNNKNRIFFFFFFFRGGGFPLFKNAISSSHNCYCPAQSCSCPSQVSFQRCLLPPDVSVPECNHLNSGW